jgi:hypothetical protein
MSIRRIFIFICLVITPVVNASHIDATELFQLQGIAQVTAHTRSWHDTNGTTNSFVDVSDAVLDTTTGRNTVVFNTFAYSTHNNATLTLNFGTDYVSNLAGNDLAIFTLDPLAADLSVLAPTKLDVSIDGKTVRYTSVPIIIANKLQGVFGPDSEDADSHPDLLGANGVVLINLDNFLLAPGAMMNEFSIDVLTGITGENPYHYPAITAAGAFNTSVVPLPLPLVLFSSGLALLGFVGRRKK